MAKRELAKRELARRRFKHFNRYIYEGYLENWHTDLLCDALERVIAGEIRFLIVEMPPRHSKSVHVSQLFPAYVVGKDKDAPIIVASYSGDLATDHGRETRNIVDSPEYQNLFDTHLSADSKAKGKWNTNGKGAYNAAGVGGSITGKGAKFFVIDDPIKGRKEADSPVVREDIWKWFKSVARTRLTPDGAIIIMHTRWHDDDMIGRITDKEETREPWVDYFAFLKGERAKWVRLKLTAVAEHDEPYRKEGEALWPQRYPLLELEDIKKTIGSFEWSSLYQQNPIDEASQEFRRDWFKYRTWEEVQQMETRKFATIDTAISKRDEADATGVTRNYVDRGNNWNIKCKNYRINSLGVIELIFELHAEGMEAIGIEEGVYKDAIEPFLMMEMKKRNIFPRMVTLKHNQMAKPTRIRGLIPRYEGGTVFHIVGECVDLEEQLIRFPKAAHDDCPDSEAYQLQIAEPPSVDDGIGFGLYNASYG